MKNLINKEVFTAVKKAIKSKNKTYKDVAHDLSMSESGFKKLMQSEDCSLSKLNAICQSIGMSLNDVLDLAGHLENEHIRFNKKQEDLMMKEPSVYYYFSELNRLEYNEQELRKIHKLTKQTSLKYLRKLDKIDLIELGVKDQIKPKHPSNSGIILTHRLGGKVISMQQKAFFYYTQDEIRKQSDNWHLGSGGRYLLKPSTIKELKKSFLDLSNEYWARSKREKILFAEDELKTVDTLIFMAEGFNQAEYTRIDKI